MFLVGLWQVQVGMARALRAAFRHHHQFRWDPDPALSKVHIFDEWPLVPTAYPRVTVSVSAPGMLAGHRGIGDDYAGQDTTPISINGASRSLVTSEIRSGTNDISANLVVEARSSYEALQVADWCVLFIRSFAVEKFQREGLYVRDMAAGQVAPRLLGSDPLFSVTIAVSCLTEFSRTIPVSVSQTVDGLCLVGVFSSLPDGTTYGETYS